MYLQIIVSSPILEHTLADYFKVNLSAYLRGEISEITSDSQVTFWQWPQSSYATIKVWLMECCWDGCQGLYSLQKTSEALLAGQLASWSPPWPRSFLLSYSVWLNVQLEEESWWFQTSSMSQWLRPLFLGILKALEKVLYPCPDQCFTTILWWRYTESSLDLGLVFCPYIQSELWGLSVQAIQYATDGLQSNSRYMSMMHNL